MNKLRLWDLGIGGGTDNRFEGFFQGLPIAYMDAIERLAYLADKVKMLFIDACRGSKRDEGVNIISRGAEHVPFIRLPEKSNFLACMDVVERLACMHLTLILTLIQCIIN